MLHEFSALDADLLRGMAGDERRPIADAYWREADPKLRHGPGAETFVEFSARVDAFMGYINDLPDRCILFGHGIWFGLLIWKLMGFASETSADMKAFRLFQRGLPMPNCAVYTLFSLSSDRWSVAADTRIQRAISAVTV